MRRSFVSCTAPVIVLIILIAGRTAHAQTPAWRCAGEDCPEALINDIEDLTISNWPAPLAVPMPPIQATCADFVDNCRTCAAGTIRNYAINWTLGVWNSPRSFLIGRYNADMDILSAFRSISSLTSSAMRVFNEVWDNTAIDYSFAAAATDVPAQDGSTGVADLGAVNFTTTSGAFWTATLPIVVDMTNFAWCTIGSERHSGPGGTQIFNVPLSSLPVSDLLAEAIRNQFRAAVRRAVTGAP